MDAEEHKMYSAEILRQLGGCQFIAMCGVQYPAFDGSQPTPNLSFKFRGSPVANFCKIVVDGNDTYTVTFIKVRGTNVETVKELDGVYAEMLQDIFTETTGLYTHL